MDERIGRSSSPLPSLGSSSSSVASGGLAGPGRVQQRRLLEAGSDPGAALQDQGMLEQALASSESDDKAATAADDVWEQIWRLPFDLWLEGVIMRVNSLDDFRRELSWRCQF